MTSSEKQVFGSCTSAAVPSAPGPSPTDTKTAISGVGGLNFQACEECTINANTLVTLYLQSLACYMLTVLRNSVDFFTT